MPTKMKGRSFGYTIHGFDLQATFEDETHLRWTNHSKPADDATREAVEQVDRSEIADGIMLMAWSEASGVHVSEVLDLNAMMLHSNLVKPDGTRSFASAAITELTA